MDGKHKIAAVAAIVAWGLSIMFSQEGFALSSPKGAWMGWALAGIITAVELVFNTSTSKMSQTLVLTGLLCYLYGIWTNITGFWDYQHPDVSFVIFSTQSILSLLVGTVLEILPEPLFMWAVGTAFEGDFIGNLSGLWSGQLSTANALPQRTQERRETTPEVSKFQEQHRKDKRPEPQQRVEQNRNPTYHPATYTTSTSEEDVPEFLKEALRRSRKEN